MTSKLRMFRAPNGEEFAIRPVSEMLILELDKQFPDPPGDVEEVTLPNGEIQRVENRTTDAYLARKAKTDADKSMAIARLYLMAGVVMPHGLTDEQKGALADYRNDLRESVGIEIDTNDKYAYLNYVAFGNFGSVLELINAIKEIRGATAPKSTNGPGDTTSE